MGGSFGVWVGSPPRVRGKLRDFDMSDELVRLTPACAGKTPALEGRESA